jgi:hypothetical protein
MIAVGLTPQPEQVAEMRPQIGAPKRTSAEPNSEVIEEFLAMLRFTQRSKLAELPVDLAKGGSG